jgi:hypothetical protein
MGLKAGLDVVAKRKTPYPCRKSNPGRPARNLVAMLNLRKVTSKLRNYLGLLDYFFLFTGFMRFSCPLVCVCVCVCDPLTHFKLVEGFSRNMTNIMILGPFLMY